MKKLAMFLLFILMCSNAFAANLMTDSYSFTVIADTKPPYVTDKFPADGAVGIPVDSKISCTINDDETGVDIDTIVMRVNGVVIAPTITGTQNAYFVEYTPGILPWNQVIVVDINASDLAQ